MRLKSYIGDKAFYRRVLLIAIPIILQNVITSSVAMVDNLMVGKLSTAEISAVTIVNNNLLFIFNLCLFGGNSSAEIFITQFFGSDDHDGIRYAFRCKTIISLVICGIGIAIFLLFRDPLIGLYLQGDGDAQVAADTLKCSREYMFIMLVGLLPFALTNAYAGTMRSCSQPMVPMLAGFAAMFVNIVLNYVLIFGNFGAPPMGVAGAAIATVISRYVEFAIVVIWSHMNSGKLPFVKGLYRSLYIPASLLKAIAKKGLPLIINETMWSLGTAFLNQCYSVCGLDVVPALSISSTIQNFAGISFRSMGATISIIIGQKLGSGCSEWEARDVYRKLTALSVVFCTCFGIAMAALSGWFPKNYNTTAEIQGIATGLILINSACMIIRGYDFPVYFTLRAGGKTGLAAIYDCCYVWVVQVSLAFILSRFTNLHVFPIFAICNGVDILKCVLGGWLIKKGSWIQNLAGKRA